MSAAYLTRVRMEIALTGPLARPALPDDFYWVPWDDSLLSLHAEVHYRAFADCIDRELFASFRDRPGCGHLLSQIRQMPGFLPEASWLVGHPAGCCATIQCVEGERRCGSIQNVGVLPRFRGRGLGAALVQQALICFAELGLRTAYLDVTAENQAAYRLYERLGFARVSSVRQATLEAASLA